MKFRIEGDVLKRCQLEEGETTVVVPEGVKVIGERVFARYLRLVNVIFPQSLTRIGKSAFRGCENLETVVLPDSVTEIEGRAFCDCRKLSSIQNTSAKTEGREGHLQLPKMLTHIKTLAFENCTQLTSVEFPDGLLEIEAKAFKGCTQLTSVNFPDGLLEIGRGAFEGCPLKSVTLPPSVKKSHKCAFVGCNEITIYDSIDADGGDCYECFDPIWNEGKCGAEIGTMPVNDFFQQFKCTIIVRSAETGEIKYAVEMDNDLNNYNYRNVLFYGWGKNATFAFRNLDRIFSGIEGAIHRQHVALMRLQYGVDLDDEARERYREYISQNAQLIFLMCIREERMDWLEVCKEAGAFRRDTVEYAIRQAEAENKPDFTAFFQEYQNKHFPPSEETSADKTSEEYLKNIWSCEALEDGTLCLVSYLGVDAEITVPDSIGGKPVSTVGGHAFSPRYERASDMQREMRKNITSVAFGKSVRKIGEEAFYGCENLSRITLPESVKDIGARAFRDCKSLTGIAIPASVSNIGEHAFDGCVNLKKVHMASPSTHFEPRAFNGCTGLEHMILGDNETVLAYCPPACANGRVRLPETITRIEDYSFEDCKQLTAVDFPDGLREIGWRAFIGCTQLSAVNFPEGLLKIELGAFEDCTQLSAVNFPEGLREIGRYAFEGCPLKSVTLPRSVKKAPAHAFVGCREINIYDNIDADCGDCYADFESKRDRDRSGSQIGLMPIRDESDPLNCTIIVRSAATGDIKYIVEMETDSGSWGYRDLLFYGWGKNATFAFGELDKFFPKIEGATRKQRVALLRLQYGVDLDEETREYYQKYLSRNIKMILLMCIREDRMDWVKICEEGGALRKDAVEYAIGKASEAKKPDFTAFFLDYQSKHFPLKAGKDNAGLRLPALPRERKRKPVDKTSEEYIRKTWVCEELEDGTLCLVKYFGDDTEITVPDAIDGKTISVIGDHAFSPSQRQLSESRKALRRSITSVALGSGIREIGEKAFMNCTGLKTVSLAASEPALPDGKTSGKRKMKQDGVTVKFSAFAGCTSLTSVIGGENIVAFWGKVFSGCTQLKEITLSPEATILRGVFEGCASLDMILCYSARKTLLFWPPSRAVGDVVIPEGIKEIGWDVFVECDQLTSVQFPSTLTHINSMAFVRCNNLKTLIFPEAPERIDKEAFCECGSLKTMVSPRDLKKVSYAYKAFTPKKPRSIQQDISGLVKEAGPLPNLVIVR